MDIHKSLQTMIYISHRGNLDGKNPLLENSPHYVDNALDLGYDVEIDFRVYGDDLYLGHDKGEYRVNQEWMENRVDRLWVHCKNVEAIEWMYHNQEFNYFWHEEDTLTITSKKFIWAFPGKQPIKNSIAVMPEIYGDDVSQCVGICSDIIKSFKI